MIPLLVGRTSFIDLIHLVSLIYHHAIFG